MYLILFYIFIVIGFSNENHDSKIIDLIMKGEYELLSNNAENAKFFYEKILDIDSSCAFAYLSLSEINLIQNDLLEYSKSLSRAFELDSSNVEVGIMCANAYIINSQIDKAESHLLNLNELFPNNNEINFTLIELYKISKQWLKLINLNLKLFEINFHKKYIDDAVEISILTDNEKLIIDKLTSLLIENYYNVDLFDGYLKLIYSEQLYEEAKNTLLVLTKKDSNNKSYQLILAEIYAYLNEFKESKNILNPIIDSLDLNSSLYKLLLITYSNLSDYNTILKFSENYINLFPKDKDGYENKAIALLKMKKNNELVNFLELAKSKFPTNIFFKHLLGDIYNSEKKYQEAELEYLSALKLTAGNKIIRNSLLTLYESKKNYSKSDSIFQVLISEDENDALTLNNYAYSLCERDIDHTNINYALELSKKAVDIDPLNAAYLDTMGWIYFKKGDYMNAENFIKNSIEIDKNNAIVLEHLAEIYIKKNEINIALKYFRLALKNDPNNYQTKTKILKYENR